MSTDDIMKQIEAEIAPPMPPTVAIEFINHVILNLEMLKDAVRDDARQSKLDKPRPKTSKRRPHGNG